MPGPFPSIGSTVRPPGNLVRKLRKRSGHGTGNKPRRAALACGGPNAWPTCARPSTGTVKANALSSSRQTAVIPILPCLRNLPVRTTFIGRIRKDAKLFARPPDPTGRGRRRYYGEAVPTPEQYRQDDSIPWQQTKAFLSGQTIDIEFKAVGPLRWRSSGPRDLLLVIIRPLAHRPAKGRHLIYRDPIYLLCTDLDLPLQRLVQWYLWRWEVEVGFRDQKTLLGSGEAQVRKEAAVERVPALIAVAYAFLHLSLANAADGEELVGRLPRPLWQPNRPGQRISTQQAVNLFRAELWGAALGAGNKTDFAQTHGASANSPNLVNDPASAILYATR